MDKQLAKKADTILFVKVNNDGFDLGAQRRAIEKNDLTEALAILQQYKQALQSGEDPKTILSDSKVATIAVLAEKSQIAKNGDYNLTGERYKESLARLHDEWPMVELGDEEFFNIASGGTPDSQNAEYWNGNICWATLVDLPAEDLITEITDTKRTITVPGLRNSSAKLLPKNSILVSSRATIGRIAVNKVELATNQGFKNIVIKDFGSIDPYYVAYMMTKLVEQMESLASGGTFKEISKTNFSTLKLPLPPLEVQQEIVAELDSYQKIIDGAKQVVENYIPTIQIVPSWERVELGEIAEISTGTTPSTDRADYYVGSHAFIKTAEINNCIIRKAETLLSDNAVKDYNLKVLPDGTVLMAMYGQGKTRGQVALLEIPASITQNAAAIQTKENVDPKYLYYYLLGQYEYLRKAGIEGHISHLNLGFVKKLKIYVPAIDEQKKLVAQIEEEQKFIDGNKKLIEIFDQKIKDKIAEVWGTDITPNDDNNASANGTLKETLPAKHAEIKQAELGLG